MTRATVAAVLIGYGIALLVAGATTYDLWALLHDRTTISGWLAGLAARHKWTIPGLFILGLGVAVGMLLAHLFGIVQEPE